MSKEEIIMVQEKKGKGRKEEKNKGKEKRKGKESTTFGEEGAVGWFAHSVDLLVDWSTSTGGVQTTYRSSAGMDD